MRPLREVTAASVFLLVVAAASAAPLPASGYAVETAEKPGAIFGALARDGDDIIVTDLASGRLLRHTSDGRFVAFGPTLPHGVDVFGDPIGPYKAVPFGRGFLVAQGTTPVDQDEGPNDHAVIEVDETRVVRVVRSDFWNPFDFIVDGATLFVVDAARNDVERLDINGAGKETLFTFARLEAQENALQPLSPTEFDKHQSYDFDAVPTGIAAHDNRLYVSLFGGFPFIAGAGRVVSLGADGKTPSAKIEADRLNAPTDVAFDTDGGLLVLEHGTYNPSASWVAGSGRLIRIDRKTGERQILLGGLTRPVGLLLLDDDELVVSELGGQLVFLKRKMP